MTRTLRIEFPGAVYVITTRGNDNQSIFQDDGDRQAFLDVLGTVVERYHWVCYAYCLMGNSYQLVVETPDANISRGMR